MLHLSGGTSHPVSGILIVCLICAYFSVAWYRLRHVPGPLLAKFSNLQRMQWVRSGRAHDIHIELHNRYGNLVRMGPNMVSVSDPAAISVIYGFDGSFKKVSVTVIGTTTME